MRSLFAMLIMMTALVVAGCGDDDGTTTTGTGTTGTNTTTTDTTTTDGTTTTTPANGATTDNP